MSRHYYFFEKLKILEKQLCKQNCSYGKVSHTLNSLKTIVRATFCQYDLLFGFKQRI